MVEDELLPLSSVRQYLSHSDPYVREAASATLRDTTAFSQIDLLKTLDVCFRYGFDECEQLLHNARDCQVSPEALTLLRQGMERTHSPFAQVSLEHLLLFRSPIEALQKISNTLNPFLKTIVCERLLVRGETTEVLWDKLCARGHRDSYLKFSCVTRADLVVEELSARSDFDGEIVLKKLMATTGQSRLDSRLVRLLGNKKFGPAAPLLVELFTTENEGLAEEIIRALARIQNPEISGMIAERYERESEFFRTYASGVFECIYHEESVDALLKTIPLETIDWVRTFMLNGLLQLNSPRGLEYVVNEVRHSRFDPETLELRGCVLPHATILGTKILEADDWRDLRLQAECRNSKRDNDPTPNAKQTSPLKLAPITRMRS